VELYSPIGWERVIAFVEVRITIIFF